MCLALTFLFFVCSVSAQSALQQQIQVIAADADGKVSVTCSLPVNCDLDPRAHPPMQSVFKLPLAIIAFHLVEEGQSTHSPLQDKYPDAQIDVPLRELLRLAVTFSDNAAADLILRVMVVRKLSMFTFIQSASKAFISKTANTALLAT